MIKWTHFISPCKIIDLFQDIKANFAERSMSCMFEISPRVMRARF